IDPGAGPFGIPGDNDFYQFVAQETGVLDLQLYFKPIGTLANGRAGLPGDGELLVRVYDSDGLPMRSRRKIPVGLFRSFPAAV
ncbi:MAG: hypothetical protein HC805_01790, partial [Alkalinema sp. RL_2_19]|nr:hypothetical protein [Alkalinema sp. RL_2_19]